MGGRVHPVLHNWLQRLATGAAAHADGGIWNATEHQLERIGSVQGATLRRWLAILSCSIARAQGRHIAEAPSRCVRSERDAEPPPPELFADAAAAALDASTSLCDFASSAAAALPMHSSAASLLAA